MKNCSKCKIDKELSEFYKCRTSKDGTINQCKTCKIAYTKEWGIKNKDKTNAYKRAWKKRHPEQNKALNKVYSARLEVRQHSNKLQRARYANNPEKYRAQCRAWSKANIDVMVAKNAKRRAAKLQRTPAWLTADDWKWINWHYKHAKVMSKMYGEPYHVDHKAPLQGETVCGLHVPLNLQVISEFENLSKGNKFLVEDQSYFV